MIREQKNVHIKYTYHVYDNNGIFLVSCVGLEPLFQVTGLTNWEFYNKLGYDYSKLTKFSYGKFRIFPELNKSLEKQVKDKEIKRVRSKINGISETRYYKINGGES